MRRIALLLPGVPCAMAACSLLVNPPDAVLDDGDSSTVDSSTPSQDTSAGVVDASADTALDRALDTARDTGRDAAVDTAADAPVEPAIVCLADTSSLILVADTSTLGDAGALGFAQKVWIAKTTTANQIFVYAQLLGSTTFLEYPVDFRAVGTPTAQAYAGFSDRGIDLLDVSTTITDGGALTNVALASYPGSNLGAVPMSGIQVVPLRPSFTAVIPNNAFAVTKLFAAHLTSGVFLQPTPTSAEWVVSAQGTMNRQYTVLVGAGSQSDASGPAMVLAASPTFAYSIDDAPFFDMGGSLYAVVSGVDPGKVPTVFRWPDDWSGDASASPVTATARTRVLAARPSAGDPSTALVLVAVPDSTRTHEGIYAARVPASQLTSLNAGAPTFVSGSLLEAGELPATSMGQCSLDDETAIVGPTLDGTGLQLVWLGPDGRAISHPATNGPLVPPGGNTVAASAVQFEGQEGESAALFFVAWIEIVAATGAQQLFAEPVFCAPPGDGG
jgi:hypothetical protein